MTILFIYLLSPFTSLLESVVAISKMKLMLRLITRRLKGQPLLAND